MLIRRKKELPPGIVFLKEKMRPLVRKIHMLDDESIQELEIFADYLMMGTAAFYESTGRNLSKVFDFMDAGMRKTG